MVRLEPIPETAAARTSIGDDRVVVIADYHAGIETALRQEGVELRSRAEDRRDRLLNVIESVAADRVLVVGDLGHSVGEPAGSELEELESLIDTLPVPLTLVPGNHDAGLGEALGVDITPVAGTRLGDVGVVHGHSWPGTEPLSAPVVVMGHEHPMVRLEDEVGGSHVERVWLRGVLDPAPFLDHGILTEAGADAELVVVPAFNELSGGTWVNVPDQEFLSPFLPAALPDGQAYLLDGTDLGRYASV